MKYRLQDLIDIEHFQNLQDRLNEIYSFPSAIIDNDGNILTATAWQDICTKFHRVNKESEKHCIASDKYILEHIDEANPAVSYQCPHGLVDNATPIIIDGVHYGNFFTGQFFLEPPDLDFFKGQARKYGYDEETYLAAVKQVPIWSRKQLDNYLFFIKGLIAIISESALKNLKEIETRKLIEQNQEQAATILEQMHDAFWINDVDTGRILDVNDTMCRMTGYSREELLDLAISDIVTGESPEFIAHRIDTIKKKGSAQFESHFRHKDGTVITVDVSVSYLAGRNLFFGFHRDITEKKRMEEEFRKAQKLESLGIMAGGIAHDFNNLLGGIYGYIELAGLKTTEEKAGSYIAKALQTIDRARGLTGQLLTFAKGGTPVKKVSPLFPFVQDTARFALSGSAVSCTFDVGEDLWSCDYDRGQIGQVIENIVLNAQQAMPGGGNITVRARNLLIRRNDVCGLNPGRYVELTVTDTGVGIPEEYLPRVFDPFFTTKTQGHGLGLATCYSIISRHAGQITVDSESGKGTRFTIIVPASGTGPVPAEQVGMPHGKGQGTVIIMDDETVVSEITAEMARTLGYTPICCGNGDDVMRALTAEQKEGRPVVGIILDLTIPGSRGGVETVRTIRKTDPHIPVFVSSGYADNPVMSDPAAYGFTAGIAKPFSLQELGQLLSQYISS